ncbi:MAG: cation-transporting P-type ATPase [Cyanobacteriota bacterium]
MTRTLEKSHAQSWHAQPADIVAQLLEVDPRLGLSAAEVAQRRERYGPNELKAAPGKSPLVRFLLQFHQPLLYILLIAGSVKAFLGSWVNAWVIWGVTLINAIIGYVQEAKAESAIAALAATVQTEATVVRDGQTVQVSSAELVPGDVVKLVSGDKVPADLRLVTARNLQISESALTGESVAVEKQIDPMAEDAPLADRRNMAYAGSFVTSGRGRGIVVAIANDTETGRISQLMQRQTNLSTPLTRKFEKFSKTLLYFILAVAALTFAVGLGYGNPWPDMFEAAVALAVSAIPEGLPAVVTITLAIGVSRMARRHAIIRKLPAVEALGSATVICSDKTGTLTENQMTVQEIYAGGEAFFVTGTGYGPAGTIQPVESGQLSNLALRECLKAGLLCNESYLEQDDGQWQVIGDPTEGALIVSAQKAGFEMAKLKAELPRVDFIPFESEHQYMATLHSAGEMGDRLVYAKGSVEAIVSRCDRALLADGTLQPLDPTTIYRRVDSMTEAGMRVLAFATKSLAQDTLDPPDIETGLTFLGLQGMIDPPRQEAIRAVRACQSAGVQVKMITGDHIGTATAIARQIGLQRDGQVQAFTGQALAELDDQQLANAVENGSVFARVAPEQKLRLVEALQARGEVVAMTGDGVNDAPALRQADIGTAMGRAGTEVAKEAADMILTDDNFASIEAAVEEGRTVYRNLLKAIAFLLPVNGGESMSILISVLLNRALPILSLQVLWMNMINSIAMTVPLSFEPKSERVMQRPPRNPREPLLNRKLLLRVLVVSLFNWIVIFGVFEWIHQTTDNIALARTMAIQALVAGRIFYLLSISELGLGLIDKLRGRVQQIPSAPAVLVGIAGAIALQVLFSQWSVMNRLFATAPLNWEQWGICLLIGVPMIGVAAIANKLHPPE